MPTSNVTRLIPVDSIQVGAMATATKFYTKTWEKNDFAFSPHVDDLMSRHTKLLERFRDKLINTAQKLDAKISPDTLGAILELSGEQDDSDLKAQALEEVASISGLLAQQSSFIAQEFDAVDSLPELSALEDVQRISKQLEEKAALATTAEQTAAQLALELEAVDKAIATLKDTNLEAKSGGLVPPTEELNKLFDTAAKAQVVIAGVQLALKTLEQALGVAVSGMAFKSLYDQASQLRERANQQKAEVRVLTTESTTLKTHISVLEILPQLRQELLLWKDAGKQLLAGLGQYQASLKAVAQEGTSDLRSVQKTCQELLAFEKAIITKMSA